MKKFIIIGLAIFGLISSLCFATSLPACTGKQAQGICSTISGVTAESCSQYYIVGGTNAHQCNWNGSGCVASGSFCQAN